MLLGIFSLAKANGLQISALEKISDRELAVELSWENAWHLSEEPGNYDAVWLFLKGKGNGGWETLRIERGELEESPDLRLESVSDQMGLMVYPEEGVQGSVAARIRLSLSEALPADLKALEIFGIEMVWISPGAFELGDGESNNSLISADSLPYVISSEAEIPDGALLALEEDAPAHSIPADWPKAFAGYYLMKYELSQWQYVAFLNTLSPAQQVTRTASDPAGAPGSLALNTGPAFRNGIRIVQPALGESPAVYGCDANGDGQFNGPEDGQDRACNFMNWDDLLAYLDWAGLSPLTEFEFEKACRGPRPAQGLEFAWGSTSVEDANTVMANGSREETVAEQPPSPVGLASHGYDGPQGPLRTGFAAHGSSDRFLAGAGYYGNMELSGNLWELCVNVSEAGLRFRGTHGDGQLDAQGNADTFDWPAAAGGGFRGGAWNSGILPGFRDLAVSDRFYIGLSPQLRRNTSGGRGVRR